MQMIQLKAPSGLHALLWKDFYLVKPALAAIGIGVLALQFLMFAVHALEPSYPASNALEASLILALITPILAALACCGMLVGHERQSGTWAWSSGLPQSWRQALSSKLIVSLFSSGLLMVPSLMIPVAALWLGNRIPQHSVVESVYASPIIALVMIEVFVFLTLTTLIFRETLTGMVVGAIGILIAQLLFVTNTNWFGREFSWLTSFVATSVNGELISISAQMLALIALGSIATVVTFRWRWGSGQLAQWSIRRPSASALSSHTTQIRHGRPPSQFWAVLVQSFRMSLGTRLAILVGLTPVVASQPLPQRDPGYAVLLVIAIGVLGTTVFEGDQPGQRYRFLADRGVSSRKLVTARLLAAGSLALAIACMGLIVVTAYDAPHWRSIIGVAIGCLIAFVVSAFCSLCFKKPIIAVTVAFVSLIAMAILAINLGEWAIARGDVNPHWLPQYALSLAPFSILLILIAIYKLAAHWLTTDRPNLEKHFAWILPSTALLPILLPVLFGFLAVPNVPWQGAPLSTLNTNVVAPEFTVDTLVRSTPSNVYSYQHLVTPEGRVGYFRHLYDNRFPQDEYQARVQTLLDDLQQPQRQSYTDLLPLASQLNSLIAETAALARLHCYYGEFEMAKKLWRCNKLLQDIDLGSAWMLTIESRTLSLGAWQLLSERELRELGTLEELRSQYLPDESDHQAKFAKWLREQATLQRESLYGRQVSNAAHSRFVIPTSWAVREIPTLRWRHERSLALNLAQSLENIEAPRYNRSRPQTYDEMLYGQFRSLWTALEYRLRTVDLSPAEE